MCRMFAHTSVVFVGLYKNTQTCSQPFYSFCCVDHTLLQTEVTVDMSLGDIMSSLTASHTTYEITP
jgi:hypothetical protein